MNLIQLRTSLALWRTKYRFRDARWNYWRKHKNTALVAKWEKLRLEAIHKINQRKHEIAVRENVRVTMYDSVTVSAIPVNAQAAAGYVNGKYANYEAIVRRTPHAKHMSITINATGVADCLDVETGDATPSEAPGWVRRELPRLARAGKAPVVYANASTYPEVLAACDKVGVPRTSYRKWVAKYDGVAVVPPGFDAKQYEEKQPQNVDLSICHGSLFT